MPLFTIATITYNQEQWVRQAIESVLSSSFTDFEYIIADDGSTDRTWQVIQSYKDPRIKAWRNDPNLGEYPNRNDVLNKATGEFILFVDGDDILYKHSLEEYARYIKAFPQACGVWGVHANAIDFIVFPYQVEPLQLTRFNFLSRVSISIIGLTESVFKTECLKKIGGFDPAFGIADTYAKKKFGCLYPVVLTTTGKGFWRQSPNQASQRVRKKLRNLVEMFRMDKEIIESPAFPLRGEDLARAKSNFRNRRIKLVVSMTLLRLDIYGFFRLMKTLEIPFSDLRFMTKKAYYGYNAGADAANPLVSDFNFQYSKDFSKPASSTSL